MMIESSLTDNRAVLEVGFNLFFYNQNNATLVLLLKAIV